MSEESDPMADFVNEVTTRAELLELVEEEPRTARELADRLPMARSTVHRATETLERFALVEKPEERIESTGLGRVVADEFREFRATLETAYRLESFLNTIDDSEKRIPLEHFTDATVTRSRRRQPHIGVKRITDLIRRTDSLRLFSSIISPLYVDVALQEMLEGTEIEVVFDREAIEIIADRYAEEAKEAFETGRFDVYVADSVPFELFLFDDRMGMAAHDEAGIARAFVESEAPEARAWAEDRYREYAEAADPFVLD